LTAQRQARDLPLQHPTTFQLVVKKNSARHPGIIPAAQYCRRTRGREQSFSDLKVVVRVIVVAIVGLIILMPISPA
jgi:hypothetical protein